MRADFDEVVAEGVSAHLRMEPEERYGNIATLIYCSTDCCLSIVVCC